LIHFYKRDPDLDSETRINYQDVGPGIREHIQHIADLEKG